MREALLGFEIADELAAATLGKFVVRELDMGGLEVGGDVGGGGFFAYDEDLSAECRGKSRPEGLR